MEIWVVYFDLDGLCGIFQKTFLPSYMKFIDFFYNAKNISSSFESINFPLIRIIEQHKVVSKLTCHLDGQERVSLKKYDFFAFHHTLLYFG